VPVLFTKVSATPKENNVIEVSWAVESETGIGHYEIERSNTQTGMQRVGSMPLHLISGTNQSYYFTDGNPLDGINFYRIKAIGTNGQLQYSQTVHAQLDKYSSTLEVYPNPVTGHQCWINLKGASKGSYTIQLLNQLGQVVYAKKIALLDNPNPVEIKLDTKIATGMYYLKIDNGFKTVYIQQVMIK
jgi:hypothetical protein